MRYLQERKVRGLLSKHHIRVNKEHIAAIPPPRTTKPLDYNTGGLGRRLRRLFIAERASSFERQIVVIRRQRTAIVSF